MWVAQPGDPMSLSFRPQSNEEREWVCSAVLLYLDRENQEDATRQLLQSFLKTPVDNWRTQRSRADVADREMAEAHRGLETSSLNFNVALRKLSVEIRRSTGDVVEIQSLIGISASMLSRANVKTRLRQGNVLREQLRAVDLICPFDKLESFDMALNALSVASEAEQQATLARSGLRSELSAAEDALDRATGKMARALKAIVGEDGLRAVLPSFIRAEAPKAEANLPA